MNQCPPCKIIIDGRVYAAAAMYLANTVGAGHPLYAVAILLAMTIDAGREALIHAIEHSKISSETVDKAHAWSELQCHRAKWLRGLADDAHIVERWTRNVIRSAKETETVYNPMEHGSVIEFASDYAHKLLSRWAEEDRLSATEMLGGEYAGPGWTINGIKGIVSKGEPKPIEPPRAEPK